MNGKHIITFMLLTGMVLSACGGQPTQVTPTPAAVTPVIPVTGETVTEAPATVEASVTPEPTSTVPPPRPTNAPDCTNKASFIADVTIPDNSEMMGNTTFIKTWRVMNTGTCVWAFDYTLAHYAEESLSAPAAVPLGLTYPGESLDISVFLTAPNTVGVHKGYFVIRNPEGAIMRINSDSRLWVIINVTSTVVVAPTLTSPAVTGVANTPGTESGSGGAESATVTCAFSLDPARATDVVNAVNAYRAQFGMVPYTVNPQLAGAAQMHANDMACNRLFGHTGSNGSTVASRVAASGYLASSSSENVYGSYPPLSGQEAVTWWVTDQTDTRHRLNLVSDKYIEIGVGYAFFDNYGFYVIVFGTP